MLYIQDHNSAFYYRDSIHNPSITTCHAFNYILWNNNSILESAQKIDSVSRWQHYKISGFIQSVKSSSLCSILRMRQSFWNLPNGRNRSYPAEKTYFTPIQSVVAVKNSKQERAWIGRLGKHEIVKKGFLLKYRLLTPFFVSVCAMLCCAKTSLLGILNMIWCVLFMLAWMPRQGSTVRNEKGKCTPPVTAYINCGFFSNASPELVFCSKNSRRKFLEFFYKHCLRFESFLISPVLKYFILLTYFSWFSHNITDKYGIAWKWDNSKREKINKLINFKNLPVYDILTEMKECL